MVVVAVDAPWWLLLAGLAGVAPPWDIHVTFIFLAQLQSPAIAFPHEGIVHRVNRLSRTGRIDLSGEARIGCHSDPDRKIVAAGSGFFAAIHPGG